MVQNKWLLVLCLFCGVFSLFFPKTLLAEDTENKTHNKYGYSIWEFDEDEVTIYIYSSGKFPICTKGGCTIYGIHLHTSEPSFQNLILSFNFALCQNEKVRELSQLIPKFGEDPRRCTVVFTDKYSTTSRQYECVGNKRKEYDLYLDIVVPISDSSQFKRYDIKKIVLEDYGYSLDFDELNFRTHDIIHSLGNLQYSIQDKTPNSFIEIEKWTPDSTKVKEMVLFPIGASMVKHISNWISFPDTNIDQFYDNIKNSLSLWKDCKKESKEIACYSTNLMYLGFPINYSFYEYGKSQSEESRTDQWGYHIQFEHRPDRDQDYVLESLLEEHKELGFEFSKRRVTEGTRLSVTDGKTITERGKIELPSQQQLNVSIVMDYTDSIRIYYELTMSTNKPETVQQPKADAAAKSLEKAQKARSDAQKKLGDSNSH